MYDALKAMRGVCGADLNEQDVKVELVKLCNELRKCKPFNMRNALPDSELLGDLDMLCASYDGVRVRSLPASDSIDLKFDLRDDIVLKESSTGKMINLHKFSCVITMRLCGDYGSILGFVLARALKPVYDCCGDYVHPHVAGGKHHKTADVFSGKAVCMGEGKNIANAALVEFRFSDAADTVKSVLNNVSSNPYENLDNWLPSVKCNNCGAHTPGLYHKRALPACLACGRNACNNCMVEHEMFDGSLLRLHDGCIRNHSCCYCGNGILLKDEHNVKIPIGDGRMFANVGGRACINCVIVCSNCDVAVSKQAANNSNFNVKEELCLNCTSIVNRCVQCAAVTDEEYCDSCGVVCCICDEKAAKDDAVRLNSGQHVCFDCVATNSKRKILTSI